MSPHPRELTLSEDGEEEMVMLPHDLPPANEETSLLIPTHPTFKDDDRDSDVPAKSDNKWLSSLSLAQQEFVEQSRTFLPALQSMVLSRIPWFITLRILGEMDDNSSSSAVQNGSTTSSSNGVELAAAALATTLCNVTGMSLCVGFSFALSTLAGQAKGEMFSRASTAAEASGRMSTNSTTTNSTTTTYSRTTKSEYSSDQPDHHSDSESTPNTPVVFLLRGMIIQLMLVIPVGIWWLFGIESFLIKLGQTPELSTHAAAYLKILAPSLWIYSIQWTVTAWTQSIGMVDVPATAALLGLIMHIPFNILFCYILGFGYLGCAYAAICFQTVQCTYIVSYLFVYENGRNRVLQSTGGSAVGRTTLTLWHELQIAGGSIRGFCDYLALAIPGIIVISEWWASECAIFLSGRLSPNPQTTLAAMTIYQSINSFCFMIPCGFAIAGTARVGNLLGAGNATGASMAGKVSVMCCAICSGMISILLYVLPHDFLPGLFVSSEENQGIIDQTAATIPWLAVYVFADGIQTGFNAIIKGCGRQKIVVPIVVVAYWVVGVPLAYYFGLYRSDGDDSLCVQLGDDDDYDDGMILCGDVGLVAGMTAGTWCHMLLLAVVVIGTTDWKNEAYKAKQRVIADQNNITERQQRQQQRREQTEKESTIQ